MKHILAHSRTTAAGRAGLTLIEVLIALGVFLVGAVSVAALFVTATGLHTEAIRRRTASFIAQGLLADIQAQPFRQVFAKTELDGNLLDSDSDVPVLSTEPEADYPAAIFSLWPIAGTEGEVRNSGPLVIQSEWLWYTERDTDSFLSCERPNGDDHDPGDPVLQPRKCYYLLEDALDGEDDDGGDYATTDSVTVYGDPTTDPPNPFGPDGAPAQGYLVIDEEWIRYTSRDGDGFSWDDLDDPTEARGQGNTDPTDHAEGSPVVVASQYPNYPRFYYTVQYYPTNSSGRETLVIVSVAYGTARQLQRAYFFHTTYTPTQY